MHPRSKYPGYASIPGHDDNQQRVRNVDNCWVDVNQNDGLSVLVVMMMYCLVLTEVDNNLRDILAGVISATIIIIIIIIIVVIVVCCRRKSTIGSGLHITM